MTEAIVKLQESAAAVNRMLQQNETALASDPTSFSHKLSRQSLREHLADITCQAGVEFLNLGNYVDAEREFSKAFSLSESGKHILLNLVLLSNENDWARAIPLLRMLLRIDPSFELARTNLAIAYLNLGVEKVTTPNPTEEDRHKALELFYYALGAASESDVVDQIRENLAAFHTNRGIKCHEAGDPEGCVSRMRRACEALPSSQARRNLGAAYAHLALFYMNTQKYQQAIISFGAAEDAGLVQPELINDYGIALAKVGRTAEARLAFERALQIVDSLSVRANLTLLLNRGSNGVPVTEPVVRVGSEIEANSVEALFTETFFPKFFPGAIQPYQQAA
jgi:tetratricopeptide (TPR) repeat protein